MESMEIPPCLGLGRKNLSQSVFGLFEVCFEVGLFLVERFMVKIAKTGPFSALARHPYA